MTSLCSTCFISLALLAVAAGPFNRAVRAAVEIFEIPRMDAVEDSIRGRLLWRELGLRQQVRGNHADVELSKEEYDWLERHAPQALVRPRLTDIAEIPRRQIHQDASHVSAEAIDDLSCFLSRSQFQALRHLPPEQWDSFIVTSARASRDQLQTKVRQAQSRRTKALAIACPALAIAVMWAAWGYMVKPFMEGLRGAAHKSSIPPDQSA
jgi:hypothetical protein